MFKVKDFWAVPEYAELLSQINQRIYPFIVGGEGTAKEALDALAADWNATFKKYGRVQVSDSHALEGAAAAPSAFTCRCNLQGGAALATAVMTTLRSAGRAPPRAA